MNNKVLFLDIDGVVNSLHTLQRSRAMYGIDPAMAAQVQRIVTETSCEVVLSSSWRLDRESRNEVRRQVVNFIDVTPDMHGTTDRGCEVLAWLRAHPEITRHAILDDNADFHAEQPLFKTSWATGLTPEIATEVIAYLNNAT